MNTIRIYCPRCKLVEIRTVETRGEVPTNCPECNSFILHYSDGRTPFRSVTPPTEHAAPGDSSPGAASFCTRYESDPVLERAWDGALGHLGRAALVLSVPSLVTLTWAQILDTTNPWALVPIFALTLIAWTIIIGGKRDAE